MQQPGIRSNPAKVQRALCLSVFLVPFMGSSLNLALPRIAADFSMSAFSLTFLVSSYLVATTMFQMPAARLADLLGKRRLFRVGLAIFGAATLLGGLSWSGDSLIATRFLSGFGSAFVFATNMAILTSVFPKEQRGRALGINTAVVYFSVAVGPFIGGVLSHYFGWRSIFFVCFALTILAMAAGAAAIRDEWTEAKGEPFDATGSAFYFVAIGALVMGFSYLPSWQGWALLAVAAVCVPVFVAVERRTSHPMLNLAIFAQNRNFRLASLSAMINYSASFAIGFILSLYLQFVAGMTPYHAGFVLMAQPITQSILSPLGGRLSDRMNPSILTTIGMGLIAVGLFLLAGLGPQSSLSGVVLILVLVGVGFALFSSPNVNIIMGSVPRRLSGLASATTGTARQLGQSLSMAATSLVIHHYMGKRELSPETSDLFIPAMGTCFLIFAAVCLVGMYTSASKLMGSDKDREWRHVSARLEARDENGDTEEHTRS